MLTVFGVVALNKGVNFLSEAIIFFIGGGIVIFEYQRGEAKNLQKSIETKAKEKAVEAMLDARFQAMEDKIDALARGIEEDRKVSAPRVYCMLYGELMCGI